MPRAKLGKPATKLVIFTKGLSKVRELLLELLKEQSWIGYLISTASIFIFFLLWSKLQFYQILRKIEKDLGKLKIFRDEAITISCKTLKEVGKLEEDPAPFVNKFIEYTFILPTDLDPSGIVWKLDHLLNVRDAKCREDIRKVAPKASEDELRNLENLLTASAELNSIYKLVRHFYLLGRSTKSLYILMQISFVLPLIMQMAEACLGAVQAFSNGYPIGDGAGALVAAKLMEGSEFHEIGEDMIYSEREFNGRRVLILKGKGPGGNVGKPGDAIKMFIEKLGGDIGAIIMVDAALKFEGEKTGEVCEGTGAAIGGIGTEKFKIEEVALKYKIPLIAVLIKESVIDAISPIKKEIIEGVEEAVKSVRRIIDTIEVGKTIIVAGIGNTIGIGP